MGFMSWITQFFAGDSTKLFDKPWRPENWSENIQMLQQLRTFQSPQGLDLRILVVGPIGSGKSSFITSFNTTVQGRNTYLAHSLTDGQSATNKYTVYKVKKGTDGSVFPFVFGDTMGLERDGGACTNDIIRILQGRVREGFTFNASEELNAESNHNNETLRPNDSIHCLVFVIPADKLSNMPQEIITKMTLVIQEARKLDIPQAVIMSKVDKICPIVSENLKQIYRSKKIKEKMEECSCNVGVPMNYIFPVKNYHEEISTNDEVDTLILTAVENIVNFASDFVKRNL